MIIRVQAALLLLLVGLVLPVAGSPQRFCARAAVFLAADQACAACPDEDPECDCESGENPLRPNCITAAKVLPDSVTPDALVLPPLIAIDLPPSATAPVRPCWLPMRLGHLGPDRGPPGPGGVPLYLLKRSLLV